ncbi:hypothetical protein COOONC_26852 [Cooperia oncophora]
MTGSREANLYEVTGGQGGCALLAMLTRKNSSGRAGVTSFPGRESIAAISDMLTTQQKKVVKPGYISSERLESALKIACIISLITVCLHTPKTFERLWPLTYIVLCLDLVSVLILTLEVMLRIHHEGLSLVSGCLQRQEIPFIYA